MPAPPASTETSPRSPSCENSPNTYHILQDITPPRKLPRSSAEEIEQPTAEQSKRRSEASVVNRSKSYSLSSQTTVGSNTHHTHHHEHGDVRTLPPWVDYSEESCDEFTASRATDVLLKSPPHAHSAQHHYASKRPDRRRSQDGYVESDDENARESLAKSPEKGFFGGSKEPHKGRKWDHARQGEPVIVYSGVNQKSSPWETFVKSSMYGPTPNEDGKRVDDSFLEEQTPGYVRPWRGDIEGGDAEKSLRLAHTRKKIRRIWYQQIQHVILMHPLVPLIFRVTVFTTSTIALTLSASIYSLTQNSDFLQTPSTIMAIAVDIVAMPYIGYITWDEYTGKPLGLRSPKAKMRLLLLDLFFIVFESANLSLAFTSLTDGDSSCKEDANGTNRDICSRLQALSAFLFIALVAWILTFSVSILRLVHRAGRDRGENES